MSTSAGRQIQLDGASNVRDVGGHRTSDGRTVLHGRLFRADALHGLTDTDLERLAELGIGTAIDFRTRSEVELDGPDRLPDGVERCWLPVDSGNVDAIYRVISDGDPEQVHAVLGEGRAERFLAELTRRFVSDPTDRSRFGTALRTIAERSDRPTLFHCTAGKDRTGWMTAIVLTTLGVPREDVIADYLRSNELNRDVNAALLGRLRSSGRATVAGLIEPLLEQQPDYLHAAFDEVDATFGSFPHFLADGLGVDQPTAERLRTTLLA